MKYRYAGVSRQREEVQGVIEADDEHEAQIKIRSMQIRLTSLSAGGEGERALPSFASLKGFSLGPPIDLKGMLIFTRQFSSLIDAGIPIVQCLEILHEQERRPPFKQILGQIKSDIESGQSLSDAMKHHPKAFNDLFVRIVESGEISGTLDKALRRIGTQLEKLGKIRSKIISAITYPIITIVVAVGVLIFLLVKVIPEITKLYTESQAKLPELTEIVLGISKWFQANYGFLVVGLGALVLGIPILYRIKSVRAVVDPILLKTPLFGNLIVKAEVAKFSRTISTLVATGVPLLQAFEVCENVVSNFAFKACVHNASVFVSEGKSIAGGLSFKNIFPPMVIHMVRIGEMTGKLDELLGKIADIYDEEVDEAIGNLTGLIQPVLIIGVGGLIAFLMAAMYLPIFQLAEKVSGN